MELPWKLSACQGQKGEDLLGLHKSCGLIYIHRHAELWTLGWSSEFPSIIKGWLWPREPPEASRLEGILAGLTQLCPWVTAPCPPLHPCPLTGLAPGWQLQAAHPYSAVRRMWSQDKQCQSHRERSHRRPWPCHQQHSRNNQLRITCSPRLTSHAARQLLKLISVWALLFILSIQHLFVYFPCCFPSLASDYYISISEISTGGAQGKGICCPDTRIMKRMKKVQGWPCVQVLSPGPGCVDMSAVKSWLQPPAYQQLLCQHCPQPWLAPKLSPAPPCKHTEPWDPACQEPGLCRASHSWGQGRGALLHWCERCTDV